MAAVPSALIIAAGSLGRGIKAVFDLDQKVSSMTAAACSDTRAYRVRPPGRIRTNLT
jgi:hypothetical protein